MTEPNFYMTYYNDFATYDQELSFYQAMRKK